MVIYNIHADMQYNSQRHSEIYGIVEMGQHSGALRTTKPTERIRSSAFSNPRTAAVVGASPNPNHGRIFFFLFNFPLSVQAAQTDNTLRGCIAGCVSYRMSSLCESYKPTQEPHPNSGQDNSAYVSWVLVGQSEQPAAEKNVAQSCLTVMRMTIFI